MRAIRCLVACLAAMAALATTAAAHGEAHIDKTRLESFVDGVVRHAMDEQHIAGMSVAVIDRSGPLLLKGYGIAGHGRHVDADTLFRSGSISKTVTWIAIMRLAEAGKLTLDDPVNDHLPPDLRIPDEGFKEPILIRHLMTHSAGFEDAALGVNVKLDIDQTLPLSLYLKRYRVHRVRPAGSLTVYSNYGAALAGAIVEYEANTTFQDYAQRRILRPLGAATATFREPYPVAFSHFGYASPMSATVEAHASSGFKYVDGRFVEQPWEFLPHMAPAGAMSASARDMAFYMQALLSPERFEKAHVLRTATALAMREPMMRNDPRLGGARHGFWEILVPNGEFAFGHNGGMAFQQTFMGIYPESGIAIFVAMNTARANGGPPIVITLPRLIAAEFLGTRPLQRATVPQAESAHYAGCYRPLRRPYHRTERAAYSLVGARCFSAQGDGALLSNGEDYLPLGNGVYAKADRSDEIAFGERDGGMLQFDFDDSGPSERIRYFETPGWFQLAGALALIVALLRMLAGFVRVLSRHETRALALVDGLGLLWLATIGLFGAAAVPWLADFSEPLINYPGILFPIVCWLFLIAALATAAVALALFVVSRPRDWSWLNWSGAGATLAIFAVFAATLQSFGFLGYSGW